MRVGAWFIAALNLFWSGPNANLIGRTLTMASMCGTGLTIRLQVCYRFGRFVSVHRP
jgi:hypothetical protein